MPLSRARALARAALHAVEAEGRDPAAEQRVERDREVEARRQRAAVRKAAAEARTLRQRSFVDLAKAYIAFRRTTPSGRFRRVASRTTLTNWSSHMRLYVEPILETRRPDGIRGAHFIRVVEAAVKRGGPSQGPRVRELLEAVWRWLEPRAEDLGVAMPPRSPLVAKLREVGMSNRQRERVLSPRELWHLWRATEGDIPALAFRFMLLTAARVREATDLLWSEVDLEAKLWTLPAARNKGGRPRLIPLSAEALAILRQVPRIEERTFGPATPAPLMARVRGRLRRTAEERGEGFADWQPRDLRRTAASIIGRLGFAPYEVSLVLGHKDTGAAPVTATYLRHDYLERIREAFDRLGTWVEETVTARTEPGEIVPHRAARDGSRA
jgi:integrase